MASKIKKPTKSTKPRKTKDLKTIDEEIDTTFVLNNLNITEIDKAYVLPEISKKQERDFDKDEMKSITTSLEKLGISTYKKEPSYNITYGDTYQITLFVNNGGQSYDLNESTRVRCSWCTLFPPENVHMLAVPFKYVPSYTEEYVYSPECVNIVDNIKVEPYKENSSSKKEQKAQKAQPKMNYFRKSISSGERRKLPNGSYILKEYFETSFPVCSFNCMKSKARELYTKDYRYKDVNMYINWMYKLIYRKYPDDIIPSPPREILKEYGGEFSQDEYRNNFRFISIHDPQQHFSVFKEITQPVENLYERND